MGVVYHANYLIWFNDARDALLRQQGICLEQVERCGFRFPVVDIACRYRQPARYGDEVIVHARLLSETVARLRMHYQVRDARRGLTLATGTSLQVVTDASGRLLLRAPPMLEGLFRPHPGAPERMILTRHEP